MVDALGAVAGLIKPIAMQVLLAYERLEHEADLREWPLTRRQGETPARDPVKGFAARIDDSIECAPDSACE